MAGGFAIASPQDINGNVAANMPTDPQKAGYLRLLDSDGNPIDTTENNYLRVSSAVPIFYDQVDGAAVNSNRWNSSTSGMTIAVVNGYLVLNSGNAVTSGSYAILTMIKSVPLYCTLPLLININAKFSNGLAPNATMELGLGVVASTTAPSDGAYFRWSSNGQFFCVINSAGVESSSTALTGTFTDTTGNTITMPPSSTVNHLYEIEIVEDQVVFSVDDIEVATVQTPAGQAYPFNAGRQPVFARVYTGGSAPSLAPQLSISGLNITQEDLLQNKPWQDIMASLGLGCYQSPVTAFAQTHNHANSASPVSATLSNTAAGYTTLGGKWQFAAVVGAATDYALFAYQVPVGYQLYVKDIAITTIVTGIAVVTATVLDWSIGVNSSAVSLATSDSPPTSWAPRRIPLGLHGFLALAGSGQDSRPIERKFDPPLVVDGGRYLHVILQVPNGAATATLVFRGDVMINGYFE